MVEKEPIEEIASILDEFDLDETKKHIYSQLFNDIDRMEYGHNLFKPYYIIYKSIINNTEDYIDEDYKYTTIEKFRSVCIIFINAITERFQLTVSQEFIESTETNELIAFTLSLYHFFVLDLRDSLIFLFINKINKDYKTIFTLISDLKNKKDATTASFKKQLPIEFNIIISNLYLVCDLILTNMVQEEFFEYIDDSYFYSSTIKDYFNSDIISGDFIESIHEVLKNDIEMEASVNLEVRERILKSFNIEEVYE